MSQKGLTILQLWLCSNFETNCKGISCNLGNGWQATTHPVVIICLRNKFISFFERDSVLDRFLFVPRTASGGFSSGGAGSLALAGAGECSLGLRLGPLRRAGPGGLQRPPQPGEARSLRGGRLRVGEGERWMRACPTSPFEHLASSRAGPTFASQLDWPKTLAQCPISFTHG